MAILWRRTRDGTRYEVRLAGGTCRLYSNGVLHSQYDPKAPVTGQVWDLLVLPAFFLPIESVRRVLVLGVGAGTTLLQARRFLDPELVIGVDRDPTHLEVARYFFGVGPDVAELVEADAREWLSSYDGPPFDLVVEDLFGHQSWEPERTLSVDESWARLLVDRLSPHGMLTVNFLPPRLLRKSALMANPAYRSRLTSAFALRTPREENLVGAFLSTRAEARSLRHRARAEPLLDTRKKGCRLRFSIARLW